MGDLFDDWDELDEGNKGQDESSGELLNISSSDDEEDELRATPSFQKSEDDAGDPKVTKKVALITIGCGLLLVVILFLVVGIFNKSGSSQGQSQNSGNISASTTEGTQSQVQQSQAQQGQTQQGQVQDQQSQAQQGVSINEFTSDGQGSSTSDEGWTEFDEYSGVEWADSTLSSSFTLTSKRNLLRSVGDSAYEMKTVLTGSLSGFNGSFEIEVPYSIGSRLPIGSVINAEVKYGTDSESGKMVVEKVDLV